MNFTTQKIEDTIIWVVDIGTYKIRVGICLFKNKEFTLLGYAEKRQNIENLSEINQIAKNTAQAIKKAEKDAGETIEQIIINIPFEETFVHFSSVNHSRSTDIEIDKKELSEIVETIEVQALKWHNKKIQKYCGYASKELNIIISNIVSIYSDKKLVKKLKNTNPEQIQISVVNISIPENRREIIDTIWNSINKKILKIVPSEYALTKVCVHLAEVVILDIGSSTTSIIVKKDNSIYWVQKIKIWMNDLINQIQSSHNITRHEIIRTIDTWKYQEEKLSFLDIFEHTIGISLKEILEHQSCPHKFFITWWWANNFIKHYLEHVHFKKYDLQIKTHINCISPQEFHSDITDENISTNNFNIYAMMVATNDFIKTSKDPIQRALEKIINNK